MTGDIEMLNFSRVFSSQRLCRMDLDNRQSDDRMVGFGLLSCAVATIVILLIEKVVS